MRAVLAGFRWISLMGRNGKSDIIPIYLYNILHGAGPTKGLTSPKSKCVSTEEIADEMAWVKTIGKLVVVSGGWALECDQAKWRSSQ